MPEPALRIPDRLANIVVLAFGDVGREWLAQLPTLVADAASSWQLQVGAPFEPGGNVGWAAPVRRADGSHAVLKVECPGHRNPWAAKGLRHWDGRGAARLLDSDEAHQSLLLERCLPGTNGDVLDEATASETLAGVLAELHAVEPPGKEEFEPLATFVEHSREAMWEWFARFEAPVERSVVEQADELFVALSASSTGAALLHGDLGPSNVLLSERGWLSVDPFPMLGDRAFDVGHILSRCDLHRAREHIAAYVDRLDLDARRIAGWTFACSLELALECLTIGDSRSFQQSMARIEQLSSQGLV